MSDILRPEQFSPKNETLVYDKLVELYPLWRDALLDGGERAKRQQVQFLERVLSEAEAKTLIDLGGGVGTHSVPLAQDGYEVTIFDASVRALIAASQKEKSIRTSLGRFENINLEQRFDASICMWSTINYLMDPAERQHFADWITSHTNKLIVVDQPNVLAYPKTFNREYEAEDESRKLKIHREWEIKDQIRKTSYVYQLTGQDGEVQEIKDAEMQYFMTLDETQKLFNKGWNTKHVLGDYDTNKPFVPDSSSRLITVFEKT
jgi:hypothetical protein